MGLRAVQEQVETQILASYESMYRLAYTYVKNRDDAMDVVQESAYKAISCAGELKSEQAVKTWLYRIVVNASLDLLRKRGRETPSDQLPDPGREDVYQDVDTLRALDILDPRERAVVVLRFFEDRKLQEIADICGENLSTVKTILYWSLRKLKAHLSEGEHHERATEPL